MKKHVLILEDDLQLTKILACEFTDHGYVVQTARSSGAINFKERIDFAVVDLRLDQGEHGLNSIEKIKSCYPACSIVVLSGYGSITTAVEAVKKGAFDYLTKPASFSEIEAALLGKRDSLPQDFKRQSLSQIQHEHIDYVLTKNEGNISKTAKDLGLHRQSLQRKLKKYI